MPSVVVFEIDVGNLIVGDAEREPPVARDVETPDALAIAGQLVGLPGGNRPELGGRRDVLQEGQHLAKLVSRSRRNRLGIIVQKQAADASVADVPNRQG